MRVIFLLALGWTALAQPLDPAYASLAHAYDDLRARRYEDAISTFLAAVQATPSRPDIRKDLGYTYLKVGENELARDQFREVHAAGARRYPGGTGVCLSLL